MSQSNVFVYGTLKRGFPNHETGGMRRHRYLGVFRTLEPRPLVIGGRWYSPCLIDEPGAGFPVRGEVFEVDDAGLAALDRLESVHRPDGYRRISLAVVPEVAPEQNGEPLEAWTYVKRRATIDPIREGPLKQYPLDRRYVPAARRTS